MVVLVVVAVAVTGVVWEPAGDTLVKGAAFIVTNLHQTKIFTLQYLIHFIIFCLLHLFHLPFLI